MTRSLRLGILALLIPVTLPSQESASLRRAASAYRDLAYGEAITFAQQALRERLRAGDQERAHEILGFAYAALDSARQATDAFKQLILLNPNTELDASRISPKITSLFALARTQVLVVRRIELDSVSFVAGTAAVPLRFTVTRPARVRTRLIGGGRDIVLDSSRADGPMRVDWNGLLDDGRPAPAGSYRLVIEASAGRDSYAASLSFRVRLGPVDTLAHLDALPGYALLPETIIPPRSWRPFALACLGAAAVSGTSLALDNNGLGSGSRRELTTISIGTLAVGILAVAKRPAPQPSPSNIRYNSLVREQLARQNAQIAAQNATLRRQVELTVVPERTSQAAAPRPATGGAK